MRFGSAKYAAERLPAVSQERIIANAEDLASESVVSALVDVAESRSDQNGAISPNSEDNIVRYYLKPPCH